ncbi:MAG: Zn-ribbon domain-containing OB-fold protein [Candidatus Binataceae bacterium]
MSEYSKPLPEPTPVSQPFWQAARRHELRLQQCAACGAWIYYPRARCPKCFSDRLEWKPCSGRANIFSYTIVEKTPSRAFAGAPYVLAIVELEEGARMTTNIAAAPETVRVGMPVIADFDDVTPDCTLVKFKPASEARP